MAVSISFSNSFYWLDSWILANILQLGTQSFCERFVDYRIDPGRRLFDQMIMAARSVPANIAEGTARHNTSIETEMKLTDVARASLAELQGDYFNFILKHEGKIWARQSNERKSFQAIRLDKPDYSEDLLCDVGAYILTQKKKFNAFIEHSDKIVAANALMFLCFRIIKILHAQLSSQLNAFERKGGFTENMTETRLQARKQDSINSNAPKCAKCGAIMIKKTAHKGVNAGRQFWSCSNYHTTGCNYTQPIHESQQPKR